MPKTITITILMATFGIGVMVGWVICALGSIFTIVIEVDRVKQKMWEDAEKEIEGKK